jgi:ATP-binding cassette subfamily B protein
VVGDRGYRLSGGEKQRIALARLLLKAPSVVVLDEATAHLDSESEAAIQRALETALSGRTSLVIAHRLSTVRWAHQILVVDGGEIRERGTHDELLAAGGLYAELHRIQFSRKNGDPRPDGNGHGRPEPDGRPDFARRPEHDGMPGVVRHPGSGPGIVRHPGHAPGIVRQADHGPGIPRE